VKKKKIVSLFDIAVCMVSYQKTLSNPGSKILLEMFLVIDS